jgi:exopolyphosphatase/guanosine-5'-triphosphate,3'-diphosphate pyrophosphatase
MRGWQVRLFWVQLRARAQTAPAHRRIAQREASGRCYTARAMPKFAAIDVGSNASRLLVVESDAPEGVRVLFQDRRPVRMGHSVFVTGKLDAGAIAECVEAMRAFAAKIEELGVEQHRAVVTASARDADNSKELLDRVNAVGVHLEAIDGTEEARLVKLAVEKRLPLRDKRALLVDLGGGSLELSEVHHDEVRYSTSLEIGTVRLLESFLDDGKPVAKAQERVLVEYLDRMLLPVAQDFLRRSYDVVAGTGGNFDTIAELCPVPGAAVATIDVRKARQLHARLIKMTAAQRRKAFALRADRADVIVPALYVLNAVADIARTDVILAPGVGLKEGIVHDLVARRSRAWDPRLDEHLATRATIQLGRRYHFDEPHATQVDRLACQLFDRLVPLHRLGPEDRVLLRVAALGHDIGDFIDYASHHKHTQYILEHSNVMGLSQDHRAVASCIARYHRRAVPSPKHEGYGRLGAEEQRKVKKLSAILRVADALDRGHRSKVQKLEVTTTGRDVLISAHGREDLSLEVWTAERKAEYFEQMFGKKIRVVSEVG